MFSPTPNPQLSIYLQSLLTLSPCQLLGEEAKSSCSQDEISYPIRGSKNQINFLMHRQYLRCLEERQFWRWLRTLEENDFLITVPTPFGYYNSPDFAREDLFVLVTQVIEPHQLPAPMSPSLKRTLAPIPTYPTTTTNPRAYRGGHAGIACRS